MGRNSGEVKLKNISYKWMRFMIDSSDDRHVGRRQGTTCLERALVQRIRTRREEQVNSEIQRTMRNELVGWWSAMIAGANQMDGQAELEA